MPFEVQSLWLLVFDSPLILDGIIDWFAPDLLINFDKKKHCRLLMSRFWRSVHLPDQRREMQTSKYTEHIWLGNTE